MKYKYYLLTVLTITLGLSGARTASSNPDIKDEAIKVLINFKTNCNPQSLNREVTEDGGLKFTAECSDKTFYPDGLTVLCPIRDVDVSCKIMTAAKEFKHLNMIYGPAGKNVHFSDENKEEN